MSKTEKKIGYYGRTGTTDGSTTAVYVDVLDWETKHVSLKRILLKNTDSTNGLKYKLLCYMYPSGDSYEEVAEKTLAKGETAKFTYTKPFARMILQVKDASGGSHADYQIDYIGQRL